jgi:hypothetical protein
MINKVEVNLSPSLISVYCKPIIGVALIAIGMFFLYICLTVNLKVDVLINNTTTAIAQGARITDFMPAVEGLIANGTVLNLPFNMLYIIGMLSVSMIYLGCVLIRLFIVGQSLSVMLSKEFWFSWYLFKKD